MSIFLTILYITPVLYLIYNILVYYKTRVPIITTPRKYYHELFNGYQFKKDLIIYELGCGRGDFLFAVEKFKAKKIIGFELSLLHVIYAKIKAKVNRSAVKIRYQDFFKVKLNNVDIIYLFLVEPVVIKIWNKIKKEAKPGTVVIVLSDKIPHENYFQKIATRPQKQKSTYYYLYKI